VFAISVFSVITVFLKKQAEINNLVLFRWEALDEKIFQEFLPDSNHRQFTESSVLFFV
jgi:hypothetical protein